MPDTPNTTPEPQPPDLDAALEELRQAMADAGAIIGIVLELRRNADQVLRGLRDQLQRNREAIDRTLALLPMIAVVTLWC
jgi:hypothetical protein